VHRSEVPGLLTEWPGCVEEDEGYFRVCANEWLKEGRCSGGKEEFWITQAGVELYYEL
jgi:hypothetical protein